MDGSNKHKQTYFDQEMQSRTFRGLTMANLLLLYQPQILELNE